MGALGLLLAALVVGCTSSPGPGAVMLVTFDTMRADRTSAYGYHRPTTPVLARLAAQGVRFDHAYAVMPTTDPSHASILTGLYPSEHGIRRNGETMRDPTVATLPGWFQDRGYVTSAVTARAHLDPRALGIRGFDSVDVPVAPKLTRKAPVVLRLVEQRLASMRGGNWFFWVHIWEPHGSYDPPAELRANFYDGPVSRSGRVPMRLRVPAATCGPEGIDDEVKRAVSGLYDGEIAAADRALARLIELAVKHAPTGTTPLVVVTADHGESMAEHDKTSGVAFGHGRSLHQETVRVPLVFWWDEHLAPAVVGTQVSLLDLAATVKALAGGDDAGFGSYDRSLAAHVRSGEEPEPRPVVIERRRFVSASEPELRRRQFAWIEGGEKLIATDKQPALGNLAAGSAPQDVDLKLFALSADPTEMADRAAGVGRARAQELAEALAGWRREVGRRSGEQIDNGKTVEKAPEPASDPRKLEELRSLGYID